LDKQNLRHVLINLISNAVKYSGEGKTIRLTSSLTNGQIQFTVKDEGMGVPAEDQPYLFQTFFRANNTTNIQGTGMGLYIVKRYTEIMGGTIQFSSRENEGTVFTLQFKAAKPRSTN
jgi:two-component system, LuxR family, sensor kinase FixL